MVSNAQRTVAWYGYSVVLAVATLVWVTLFTIGGAAAEPDQGSERTSENDRRLEKALQRFPGADADKDGVLTAVEARAFLEDRRAAAERSKTRQQAALKNRPAPTYANVKYGPHERNVFDVWLPEGSASNKPPAVFVFFHGGGFIAGDKSNFDPRPYLEQGYAVVSSNYRFVNGHDVIAPVPMQDCARALQHLRYKAGEFGIDPTRVAVSGGSAGAVITMWIAFKDDMANPASADPVERQSTRVSCIVPKSGPTNLDPAWIRTNIGGSKEVHSSLPLFFGTTDGDCSSEEVTAIIADASVINHASADDPPTLLLYRGELDNVPLPADASQGQVIHHPYFGKVLKDKLDALGVECEFHYEGNRSSAGEYEFLKKHLARVIEVGPAE